MDVSAILDENLDILSRPDASKAAQFLLVLSLIDRTILPREIVVTAGEQKLALAVAERKVQLAGGRTLAARELAARIAGLCGGAATLQHQVRAAEGAPAGFGVAELVNAQDWGAPGPAGSAALPMEAALFAFDERGWPVRMPEQTDAKAMVSAWLLHLWMQSWLKRRAGIFGERVLLATSAGREREVAFHIAPEKVEIMAVEPSDLGRLLATWRVMTGPWRGNPGEAGQADAEA
jgi:hypothetical protein